MNFKEVGFRIFYHNFVALKLDDQLRKLLEGYPDADKATYILMYGYIDPRKGLMLDAVAGGKKGTKYFHFFDPNKGNRKRSCIQAKKVADAEIFFFDDEDGSLHKRYSYNLYRLTQFDTAEGLEESRTFAFLDDCRDQNDPDKMKVRFKKEGLKPEDCWVRATDLGESCLKGIVVGQPKQGFGVSSGDAILFHAQKVSDEKAICVADFDGDAVCVTRQQLENSRVMKDSIARYLQKKDDESFNQVIRWLKSFDITIPCYVEVTDAVRAIFDACEKGEKNIDALSDSEMQTVHDGMTYHPSLLKRKEDGQQWVPVFTDDAEIGDNLEGTTFIHTSFAHAIEIAVSDHGDIAGIVINPYTQPAQILKKVFDQFVDVDSSVDKDSEDVKVPRKISPGLAHSSADSKSGIRIRVGKMDVFNFALSQNHVPAIRDIVIQNTSGNTMSGLTLRISSDFDFFYPYTAQLPDIPSGKPISIGDPNLHMKGSVLAAMTETVNTIITVELCRGDEVLCSRSGKMMVLAYDQWQGSDNYRDLLPAFVLPNHPIVTALLHDASDRLKEWGKSPDLEAYQEGDPNRVRDFAAAIYTAIQKKNILYAEAPASFSVQGQRIRTPDKIMDQHMGTCMDMTLLYAACLEAMRLHPLLVMMEGHIFAGVWLRKRSVEELKADSILIDDLSQLTKRFGNGSDDLTFVECTAMCSGSQVSFEDAEKTAKYGNLADKDNFRYAVDVFLSRFAGVLPIPSRVSENGIVQIEFSEKEESELSSAPQKLDISITEAPSAGPRKILTKKELWESKLLDLGQHNMLLNLPLNASVEPIMSSHIDELEDALADGHEFRLLPAPDWVTDLAYVKEREKGKKQKPTPWLKEVLGKVGPFEITEWPAGENFDINERFRQEFRSHRLYTFCGERQLDRDLTSIYRAARSSQLENGVSSLYLAIGLLRWFDPEEKEPSYAPLVLLPVEIVRKAAGQGYALHARDEEPHFNTTLLEMLRQNFNIEIGGLDPLPADEHGINIRKVFSIVRGALFSMPDWDVVESCVIGNFSFAQFAMWNDIHTAGDKLDGSPIVRSLMKGYVDFDCSLPADLSEEKIYLPIPVDATQLRAIQMASHGTTFVLHGPPGTGKSQTITAMIANLMAQGKKVLFVAEKMAALSVVQKRLSALGLGDFCLELHSDKANKKHVLSQLEKALWAKSATNSPDYAAAVETMNARKAKLDEYSVHLYQIHHCGYSLHDLIDLYESVREVPVQIDFDERKVGSISKEDVLKHPAAISGLIAAGSVINDDERSRLGEVGLADYSSEVRNRVKSAAADYQSALEKVRITGDEVCSLIGTKAPESLEDLSNLSKVLEVFDQARDTAPLLLDVLGLDAGTADAFYQKDADLKQKKQALLQSWKTEYLSESPEYWRDRCRAAEKKFFGKSSAMAAVVSDLQKYAVSSISWGDISPAIEELETYQSQEESVKTFLESCSDVQKSLFAKLPEREDYERRLSSAQAIQEQTKAFPGGLSAIVEFSKDSEKAAVFYGYTEAYGQFLHAEEQFNHLMERRSTPSGSKTIELESQFCGYLNQHGSALKDWALYQHARKLCIDTGLLPVVTAYENGMPEGEIPSACRKGLYLALISSILDSDDVLCTFSGATFNESVRQFKRLDDSLMQQSKEEIYHQICSRLPAPYESPEVGSEITLLMKAINSNARGMSIRNLFDRIPHILTRLSSCMLMSPNSVAQYLAQDNHLFDVVIFDEASQLPTCKAVGALMRAENAVIVGDQKQMPPTSFFAGGGPQVDDIAMDDLDSILDDALALNIPSQYLQWHYRSRHESLIAFSNSEFYDNQMFTFPSASERQRYVSAVYVDGGVYQKGINVKEAEAVVEDIVRRFRDPKLRSQSIGVVTFNVKQQALIENLLAKQYEKNADLDAWANTGEDPLFIKNLENVQGDERDVILFSIGYGPDEKGHLSMNFGPINKDGGGKRLNVAFSRARCEMRIFSSMHSSDLKVTESSPDGVKAFRDFLRFAEGHGLRQSTGADSHSNGDAHSESSHSEDGIRNSICSILAANGYECETMIGHSDFRVDIAVINPYDKTRYLMGILLDGETYHRTKNTRDREVSQISVLKNLDWQLRRIWTIDFWDNRELVLRRLLDELNDLKETARLQAEEAEKRKEADKQEEAARSAEMEKLRNELQAEAKQSAEDAEEEMSLQTSDAAAKGEPSKADGVAAEGKEAGITGPDENSGISEIAETSEKPGTAEVEEDSETSVGQEKPETAENSTTPEAAEAAAVGSESSENTSDTGHSESPEADKTDAGSFISPNESGSGKEFVSNSDDAMTDYFGELVASGAKIIDKREHGGALWVVGGKSLQPIMKKLRSVGVSFIFKQGGGKATGGADAWWSKADIKLPDIHSAQTAADEKSEEDENAEQVTNATQFVLVEYRQASTEVTSLGMADFASSANRGKIAEAAARIVEAEGPILKDVLYRRLFSLFGVWKTNDSVEAADKAIRMAKVKTSKLKGSSICWASGQDPKNFHEVRTNPDRHSDEIPLPELSNALCYVLQEKGPMDRDSLIKEASRVLGYKRLGKNLEAALSAGLLYAKSCKAIQTGKGGVCILLAE